MQKLILATRNPGKVKEIKAILGFLPLKIVSLSDFPEVPEVIEDGATLEENALKKAREVFRTTGIPALSDDSGLEVYHLGMEPGVFSARYAGDNVSYEDNNRKLLQALTGVPTSKRRARFRCIAALVADGVEKVTEGVCEGSILEELRGKGGFGYDPLFVPRGYGQTFAELSTEVKNEISHRAKAFLKMSKMLPHLLPDVT